VIGRFMAHETARENAIAIELLHLEPADRVLELGFGHGRTIRSIVERVPAGHVAGVDFSATMLRLASSVNRDVIAQGRVELQQGDSASLAYPDQAFDKLLAVHTIYFWEDPAAHLRECRRVLRSGGLLVLGFRSREQAPIADFPASVYNFRSVAEIRELLREAGFATSEVTESRLTKRVITYVTARVSARQ
jgi:ubiquinone/menaquinone biosynthesis C-methylase UbiE